MTSRALSAPLFTTVLRELTSSRSGLHFVPLPTPRSPLRYPGGKSRAVKAIMRYIPPVSRLCSPFVGGGSLELACAARGIEVHAYDAFLPLVDFWQSLLREGEALADKVEEFYPMSRSRFYALQKEYMKIDDKLERSAAFYAINRCSFSGITLSGGMSPGHPRFTPSSIERLRAFQVSGFHVEHADFVDSMARHEDDFLYLDPPYANGGFLYGNRGDCHAGFDHESLASLLHRRDLWIASYNDCEMARDLYAGYAIEKPEWNYGMSHEKQSNELLIFSRDLMPAK